MQLRQRLLLRAIPQVGVARRPSGPHGANEVIERPHVSERRH
ncbi:MAG: hypothetical protein HW416_3143, partial [Chloroflexi bacterium]|nr:hypothetical protein [Chloroflexota bacterium]